MTDLSLTIAPKSDQLNSDDLISGPMTVQITRVSACPDSSEQPIAVFFDGDNGKPYKPCKSMRRVMVQVWGKDGTQYAGRAMTLYRDPKVQFGGLAVGGIRISHMSHIDADVTMALTATRANRKPFTVKPLRKSSSPRASAFGDALDMAGDPPPDVESAKAATLIDRINACKTSDEVVSVGTAPSAKKLAAMWRQDRPDLFKLVDDAAAAKMQALGAPELAGEGDA